MRLRQWQSEAVARCLSTFQSGVQHFLCLATPGAGKTIMASTVAKRLFNSDKIDLVLCFSPSVAVSDSFRTTLESIVGARLDGRLGAKGLVLTYQSMINLDPAFWSILLNHRTLVIFDEIHHCAGDYLGNGNAWGQSIIQHLQGNTTYSLALTGTPWRSDRFPISLASYCRDGKVFCDYIYGLADAIKDGVCRQPNITAIDNDRITLSHHSDEDAYGSFGELLQSSNCSYQQLIENTVLIRHLLERSQMKLKECRKESADAAGLIVAATVEHALVIADILESVCHEYPTVVTYKHDDPQAQIQRFRDSDSQWVVSVGMISEGTDIPRLQVCCYLTKVKTELYYRQVLGRILRKNKNTHEHAHLIMPAEPTLLEFAHRVAIDVPSENTVSIENLRQSLDISTQDAKDLSPELEESKNLIGLHLASDENSDLEQREAISNIPEALTKNPSLTSLADAYDANLGLFGRFRNRIIKLSISI
ncbi:DEAD/DEAH box helicase family protein [Gilvimarinus sp. SDUM040013]|uniref:DEAD/DEAH box helicase family protein n=1 Tax=Gilvimarinus gilvus TaxID=3058038 RepID=A0ABU4S2H9_9GAMM|nr:DEAD/DEAH box helicase family protein [Gilvimarinus sp. SDUM040013]MDO3384928.1 DEAD/DEAH box helicase family protein [Gilvimarinus sp. SDUM040013]MDX6851287.1 DEAD/DEAH box helicase family protein [Gilvimarinus sp. SDUM040013]